MKIKVLLLVIELLFPLSASSPHPLMSPFPALSHNALKNSAYMGYCELHELDDMK